jgi:hypothetical protein
MHTSGLSTEPKTWQQERGCKAHNTENKAIGHVCFNVTPQASWDYGPVAMAMRMRHCLTSYDVAKHRTSWRTSPSEFQARVTYPGVSCTEQCSLVWVFMNRIYSFRA